MSAIRLDVEEIALAVVGEVAPEELPAFPSALERFQRDPDRGPHQARQDEQLGFGLEFGVAMSPLVLWLAEQTLLFIARELRPAVEHAAEPLTRRFGAWVRTLPVLRRLLPARPLAAVTVASRLDDAELSRVREACLHQALAVGLQADTSRLLADAIVGRLAVA